MKFTFRKPVFSLLAIVVAAVTLALSAPKAEAQFFGGLYGSQTVSTFPVAFTNAAAYTFSTPPGIFVPNGRNVAFQLSCAGSNTMSGAVTVAFCQSLDGVNWDTANLRFLSLTMVNTAQKAATTNFTIDAIGYVAPLYVTNANADFVTNCVLRYALKPGY